MNKYPYTSLNFIQNTFTNLLASAVSHTTVNANNRFSIINNLTECVLDQTFSLGTCLFLNYVYNKINKIENKSLTSLMQQIEDQNSKSIVFDTLKNMFTNVSFFMLLKI